MQQFMDDEFLLKTKTSKYLFHEVAAKMPIFDFHCHLSPMDIYEDKPYDNLYQLWLERDHYKWRAMRAAGIDEDLVTGNGEPYEKFLAWAGVVPGLIGNPLYHWTHLELQRYFDIFETLNAGTAEQIWKQANQLIREKHLSPRKLLRFMNVKALCTTDDITEGLDGHKLLQADRTLEIEVFPTFRMDALFRISMPGFIPYVKAFEKSADTALPTFRSLLQALRIKLDEYADFQCRTCDHGLPYIPYRPMSPEQIEDIYQKAISGKPVTGQEEEGFQTALLLFLFREYKKRDMVAQIHIGCLSNGNSAMHQRFGGGAGCDSIHDMPVALSLNRFLDTLNSEEMLPRTLLFTMNPVLNYPLATLGGNFSCAEIPGKVQLGTAWWLMDHRDGMEMQLRTYANCGALSSSVGMLTDSRSFLSYTRHEYYRRILCNLIGSWVEEGEYPDDKEYLTKIIQDICYHNACRFFDI